MLFITCVIYWAYLLLSPKTLVTWCPCWWDNASWLLWSLAETCHSFFMSFVSCIENIIIFRGYTLFRDERSCSWKYFWSERECHRPRVGSLGKITCGYWKWSKIFYAVHCLWPWVKRIVLILLAKHLHCF